jgi:hypothetical protein
MTTASIQPAKVHALVVGIEKYQAGDDYDLNGPANDALKFANWLLDQDVEPQNINLFLSPLDKNKDVLVIAEQRRLRPKAATRDKLDSFIRSQLISEGQSGDLLYMFWGGHGIITKTDSTTRRLFFADTDSTNQLNLNLNSLLEALKTFAHGSGFSQQIFFIDACANTYFQGLYQTVQGEKAGVEFGANGEQVKAEQFALFASAEYEVATNESEVGTGSFSKAVLEELNGKSLSPEMNEMKVLAERIQTNFRDKQKLEPVYWSLLVGGNQQVIDNRKIETIGKQYEGYETEAEVRKVVGEYTRQPLAGRSEEQEKINQFLAQNASGVLLLTAPAGFGKSSLLMHWQQTKQEDCFIAFHCFRTSSSVLRSVPNAYRHLLQQLYVYYNRREQQFSSDLRSQIRGLVDDAKVQTDKRLVIVLDGLDEAQETFEPFLSSPLPDGVFIIASARAEQQEKPKYLQGWTTNAQRLHLKRLPREAISDWVASVDSRLARYAQDNNFIEKLDEVTAGFPLYLSYLLGDLKQAVDKENDVQVLLRNTSPNFTEYVKRQFDELADVEGIQQSEKVQGLFTLLSVALGLLSKDDIQKLVGINSFGLSALPWQATRWFSRYNDLYGFAHPLLAREFRSAIGDEASIQERKLINYCANWKENNSPYALRYYSEHLLKAKQFEELYELARNEDFADAQRQGIPDEPELPLKVVRLALQGKTQEDKAGGMAEFMLLHAQRVIQITQESPLAALRKGQIERAWVLADHFVLRKSILWQLLLAWALISEAIKDGDKLKLAQETLKRLQQRELTDLSGWQANYAVYLLGQILPVL